MYSFHRLKYILLNTSTVKFLAVLVFFAVSISARADLQTVNQTQYTDIRELPTNARLYQVDIIIFKNKAAAYLPPEEPYKLLNHTAFKGDVLLLNSNSSAAPTESPNHPDSIVTPLPELNSISQDYSGPAEKKEQYLNYLLSKEKLNDRFQLLTALKKIDASDQYQVIYAASWVSDFYYGKTKSFEIFSDKTYLWPTGTSSINATEKRLQLLNTPPELLQAFSTPEFPMLDGLLKISLNRYFDIQLKLQILAPNYSKQMPITLYGSLENFRFTPLKVFHADQHIRTSSKKLVYIDNPSYGILLYLTPIDKNNIN